MICTAEVVFPQLSVAVQVLVIVPVPLQPSAPLSAVSAKVISTSLSQLSVAVMPVLGSPAPSAQLPLISAGMPLNTGGVVSSTVITCC